MSVSPTALQADITAQIQTDTGNTQVAAATVVWLAFSKAIAPYIDGGGAVSTVTAGSTKVTVSPTTGNVVVDVVPANFTGIPESGVTGLVSDLASRPTGSGTTNTIPKWTGSSALSNSSVTDDGTTFAINTNKFTVTEASGNTLVAGTLTISPMTSDSVLFAGASGVVSQDNTNFKWDNTNKGVYIGAPSVTTGFAASLANRVAGGSVLGIQNKDSTGYSSVIAYDSAGTFVGAFGYGNASATDASKQSKWYLRTQSHDFVVESGASGRQFSLFGSTGNVNVGATTTDPGVLLRVEGNTSVVNGGNLSLGLDYGVTGAYRISAYTNNSSSAFGYLIKAANHGVLVCTEQTTLSTNVLSVKSGMTAGGSSTWNTGGTEIFTVRGNGFVGVGTSTQSDNTAFAGGATAHLEVSNDAANATMVVGAYGASVNPALYFIRARGTRAAPAAVQSGDILGLFSGAGYGDTTVNRFGGGANVQFVADGNWSATSHPGAIVLTTVPTGATISTERLRVGQDGNVSIGLDAGVGGSPRVGIYSGTSTPAFYAKGVGSVAVIGSEATSSSFTLLNVANGVSAGGGSTWTSGGNSQFLVRADGFTCVGSGAQLDNTAFSGGQVSSLQIIRSASTNTQVIAACFGAGLNAGFYCVSANGTRSAPTATVNNDILGVFNASGQADTSVGHFATGAQILMESEGSWSALSFPSRMVFKTVPSGSTTPTERLRIAQDGLCTFANNVTANGNTILGSNTATNSVTVNGTVTITSTAASRVLHVKGNSDATARLVATFNANSVGVGAMLQITDGTNYNWGVGGANTTNDFEIRDGTFTGTAGTTRFRVAKATGTVTILQALDVTGNFNVNTNKFSVVATSGNTTVAGTLGVTGRATLAEYLFLNNTDAAASRRFAYINTSGTNYAVIYDDGAGRLRFGGTASVGGAPSVESFEISPGSAAAKALGTFDVAGLSTLTGGFTLGADSSANSHKITNLTNGSGAQDAAAFGQIATAVNAAVTGTSGRSARFTGTNTIGTGAFTDDGTSASISGAFSTGLEISPAQITSNQTDYTPSGIDTASILVLTSDAARDINGIKPLATATAGRHLWVFNNGNFPITLKYGTGTGGYRIYGNGGNDKVLQSGGGVELVWSTAAGGVWLVNDSGFASAVSGTTNTIAKFTGTNVVGNSSVTDDGTTVAISTQLQIDGNSGFNGTAPIAKPTVSGSRGGNAALASLLTALANYGLITDSSTA